MTAMKPEKRIPEKWLPLLEKFIEIVRSYDTNVTLRQLHYQLVSRPEVPAPYGDSRPYTNTLNCYTDLSYYTAIARREDWFPDLLDANREIRRYQFWSNLENAKRWLAHQYWLDRTKGQPVQLYLGVEKDALTAQLMSWFGDLLLPVLPVRGYTSQTFIEDVKDECLSDRILHNHRRQVLLYAGDWDPSGEDILRDFLDRTEMFDEVIRVALTEEQVNHFHLPRNPGKPTDTRAKVFAEKHGGLWQVELDALSPTDLRALYQAAIDQFWDKDAYQRVLEQEEKDRESLS